MRISVSTDFRQSVWTKCQREISFSLSACRTRVISAQYCVQHLTCGVHAYRQHHHLADRYCPWCRRKIVSSWPPFQRQPLQDVQLLLYTMYCSPWCWRELFHSAGCSFSVEFSWMVMLHKIFVKNDKSFVKPTDQPLPQCAFQIHNSKLHSLVIFKTWPDWIGTQW
jgi:hypothetical protein